jgi:Xaa-Pro aminopeptidase
MFGEESVGPRPTGVSDTERKQRQATFLAEIDTSCLVLLANNPTASRSGDVEHRHRANSYLLYLTGWTEPGGVVAFHHLNGEWISRLYVKPRDISRETWEGRRPGVEGALAGWPIDEAVSRAEIGDDLAELLQRCDGIYHYQGLDQEVDELVAARFTEAELCDPKPILDEMRLCKSEAEIALMRYAGEIGGAAHMQAMRNCKPGMGEWQLQAIIEGTFVYHQSEWAYPSIVGSGDNATILHYGENSDEMKDGDVVLIDAGCEVDGYACDITRSFPINGKFNADQKAIYNLVLKSQLAAIDAVKVGSPYSEPHKIVCEILAQGLIDLGILAGPLEDANSQEGVRQFFMHGTGHWLGLDVHDVGGVRMSDDDATREFEEGMVVTIEPGLYFGAWRDDISIDSRWAGIGIRIEDDILVTENGPIVLTASCPKTIEEIESLVGSA